jgi:hypothetical protein
MSTVPRRPYSRPVFDQTITIHSDHAQRLLDRGFLLVVRALYGIDVVLRILGDDAEMDQVEDVVSQLIAEAASGLRAEAARLAALRDANGISVAPRYTAPREVTVHVSSPQLAQYTALIQELDALMIAMDTLWLAGVLSNKQRANGSYEWRTRLLRTGRRIIDIERRARASAAARGKAADVAAADAGALEEASANGEDADRALPAVPDVRLATDQGVTDAALADAGSIGPGMDGREGTPEREDQG